MVVGPAEAGRQSETKNLTVGRTVERVDKLASVRPTTRCRRQERYRRVPLHCLDHKARIPLG